VATVQLRRATGAHSLGRAGYAPREVAAMHRHEEARLVVVVRGTFAECHGGRLREATPYVAMYRPAGEWHDGRYGRDGATCISVGLDGEPLAAPAERGGLELADAIDDLDRELDDWDASSTFAVDALVAELIGHLGRAPATAAGEPRWWRRAQALLLDGFREPLTLARLAGEADVHPVHLARTFRSRTGRSVGALLRERRVAWARAEIVRSRAPIAANAAAAGFSDESHLGRVMRRLCGVTPGALRRR
jgi:AraC family transcriptional regulator